MNGTPSTPRPLAIPSAGRAEGPDLAVPGAVYPGRRIRAVYFTYLLAFSIYQPFLNLYLQRRGLSGTEIGLLSGLRPLAGIFAPPLWGVLSDALGLGPWAAAILMAASLVPYGFILGADGFWLLAAATLAFALLTSPIIPLLDSTAMDLIDRRQDDYGRVRRWGSLGFFVGVVAMGQLGEHLPLPVLLLLHIPALLLAVLCSVQLGLHRRARQRAAQAAAAEAARTASAASSTTPGHQLRRPPVRQGLAVIWRHPQLRRFFLAGLLSSLAGVTYYTFFSIYADGLGMSEGQIGLAWGLGVASEIAVMSVSGRLMHRWGPRGLYWLGLGGAIVRWAGYALFPHVWPVLALQLLHGLTFGAYQVGAVTYLHSAVPPNLRASAQTAWAAATSGLALAAGSYVAGPLYDAVGLRPLFTASALLATAALLVAWRLPREPVPA